MLKCWNCWAKVALFCLISLPAAASDDGFSGKVAVGAIATGGNSKTSTFNVDLGLGYDSGVWHNSIRARALAARSEVEQVGGGVESRTTSERYIVGMRSALDFSEFNYVVAQVDYEKDLFGGVRERIAETLGYGRRLISNEIHKLDAELGAGARQQTAQDPAAQRESELVFRGSLRYAWTMSETSSFLQELSAESGDSNTYSEATSTLKLAVLGGVFANLGFTAKNNSQVPAGTENTDTISSVSLSYEF